MLKFENPVNKRFYYVKIEKDMLDEFVLRIIYGGQNVSRQKVIHCGLYSDGVKHLNQIMKRRIRNGYYLIN